MVVQRTNLAFAAEEQFPLIEESGVFCSYQNGKRIFDVIGALMLLVTASPILLLAALLIRFSSSGPVLFRQRRLTQGNKVFMMYKFRTMIVHAELESGAVFAGCIDPRVTKIGKILRKFRIDELPQVLNVLRGDMSLIGPRPERPEIAVPLSQKLPEFSRRLEVKAGITGLAQVRSGYAGCLESYREKLAWDIDYVENKSLLLDLKIAFLTIPVVFGGLGAR